MTRINNNHDYDNIINQPTQQQQQQSQPRSPIQSSSQQQINSNQLYGLPDTRTQLFVGNLPFRVRWQDLKDLMRKVGTVLRADVALSQPDGRSRGFGVVLFAHAEDAHKAVDIYNGFSWQTRILDVRLDSQDPTGALAIAEANRLTSVQQQQSQQSQSFQLHQQQQQFQLPIHDNSIPWPASIPPPPSFSPLPPHLGPPSLLERSSSPSKLTSSHSATTSPHISSASAAGHIRSHSQIQNLSLPQIQTQIQSQTTIVNLPRRSSSDSVIPSPLLPHTTLSTTHSPSPSLAPNSPARSHYDSQEHRILLPPPPPPLPASSSSATEWSAANSIRPVSSNSMNSNGNGNSNGNSNTTGNYQSFSSGMGVNNQNQNQSYPPPPPPSQHSPQQLIGSPSNSMHSHGQSQGGSMIQNGGLMQFYQGQQRGNSSSLSPSSNQQQQQQQMYQQHQIQTSNGNMSMNGGGGGPPCAPNRHIFVGNLPFNLQWQELKDLMRQSGTVLRADIAQGPDGRSRGFGSVLFSSSQDADRAVGMFNGYDYNGRALKVHFDKFSPTGQSSITGFTSTHPTSSSNSNSLSPYSPQTQNQHPNFSYDNGYNRDRQSGSPSQSAQTLSRASLPSQSFGQAHHLESLLQQQQQQQQYQHQQTSMYTSHEIPVVIPPPFSSYNSHSPADLMSTNHEDVSNVTLPRDEVILASTTTNTTTTTSTSTSNSTSPILADSSPEVEEEEDEVVVKEPTSTVIPVVRPNRMQISHPTRIAMPPSYPSFNNNNNAGPYSPMYTNSGGQGLGGRQTVMTPGMPAFTLGSYPQTPPLYPSFGHGFGMFSPGGMVTPSGNFFSGNVGGGGRGGRNYMNAAPGAPIHRQSQSPYGSNNNYNPMFAAQQEYQQQQHQQQLQQQQQQQQYNSNYTGQLSPPTSLSQPITNTVISNDEPSYFPEVSTLLNHTSAESITTFTGPTISPNSAISVTSSPSIKSPSPPNGAIMEPTSQLVEGGGGIKTSSMILLSEGMQSIQFTTIPPTPPVHSNHSHHHHQNYYSSSASTSTSSVDPPIQRRKSFVSTTSTTHNNNFNNNNNNNTTTTTTSLLDIRKRFELGEYNSTSLNHLGSGGGSDSGLGVATGGGISIRRASFEDSLRSRPSFGSSSIWASSESGGD